ncbi:hypothetical protein AB0I94_28300 [Streptomyces sp. NPDC050147]|uniref:HalD/BesD family halogenase n=1 Tax=Streptomyces sp. NPDC050147 TaxID=3155513 RepID=UPI003423F74A
MAVLVLTLPLHPQPLNARFAETRYLPLPGLLSRNGLKALREETGLLETAATRRGFRMKCMDDSPRHMTTLGGHRVARESALISTLYRDARLLELLTSLTGTDVLPVQDEVERHVLNILHQPGDTHGAHTDDYPLAPGPGPGPFPRSAAPARWRRLLEYHPGRRDLTALEESGTQQVHHQAGDAYLLPSDLTAHRVTPLCCPGTGRTVLNFAYTTRGHQTPTTGSARRLYG